MNIMSINALTKDEVNVVYDMAVNELENFYCGNFEEIDLANEPAGKFSMEPERVLHLQNVVKKISGQETI